LTGTAWPVGGPVVRDRLHISPMRVFGILSDR